MTVEKVRLQRFLAQAGVASRRKCEELITGGHVRVNGRLQTELGSKVDPRGDDVEVDGKRVRAEEHTYILLHKPRGYVTTLSDPERRPTVIELVDDAGARLYPVGRLDFNTEGLLLLTNDGDLANALMHPRREVEKTYEVKLRGLATAELIEAFQNGVILDDGERTEPAQATLLGESEGGHNSWLEVTIHEGKNRQIHRMAEALGFQVAKLKRVRYAGLDLAGVPPGRYRRLHDDEVARLRKLTGLSVEKSRPGARRPLASEHGEARPFQKGARRHEARPARPRHESRPSGPRSDGRPSGPRHEARPSGPRHEARPSGPRHEGRPSAPRHEARPSGPRHESRSSAPRHEGRPSGPRSDARPGPRSGGRPSGPRHAGRPSRPRPRK